MMKLVMQPTETACGQACIAMIAGYTHWVLLYDGKYYDPEFGLIEGEYPHGKITSFLGIYQ